jgi:hypothetical protein
VGSNINDGASDLFAVGITAMKFLINLKYAMTDDDSFICKNYKLTNLNKKKQRGGSHRVLTPLPPLSGAKAGSKHLKYTVVTYPPPPHWGSREYSQTISNSSSSSIIYSRL